MRLWFSVTALLILACVILDASAAKSNRVTTDSAKDNYKSTNSKEIRYSKNKNSDYKKEGNGREQEVVKERKQRHKREENLQNTDSHEILKKNRNERVGKVSYNERKNQKPNDKSKFVKSQDNVKIDKNTLKKHKRSLEVEQPAQESLTNDARGSKDSRINSELRKEKSKNKFNKKTDHDVRESLDSESKGDTIVNNDHVADDKLCKESISSANNNDSGSKKEKIVKNQQENSKKIKRQLHVDSKDIGRENVSSKKRDSTKEKVKSAENFIDVGIENGEDLILTSENSYYSNKDGVIKEKKSGSVHEKKYKPAKKFSGTASECECRESGCEISVSDTERHRKQKLKKYQSDVCNLEGEEHLTKEDEVQDEKSESSTDNDTKSDVGELEQQETEDKDLKNVKIRSTEENDVQDETMEGENCVREE